MLITTQVHYNQFSTNKYLTHLHRFHLGKYFPILKLVMRESPCTLDLSCLTLLLHEEQPDESDLALDALPQEAPLALQLHSQ